MDGPFVNAKFPSVSQPTPSPAQVASTDLCRAQDWAKSPFHGKLRVLSLVEGKVDKNVILPNKALTPASCTCAVTATATAAAMAGAPAVKTDLDLDKGIAWALTSPPAHPNLTSSSSHLSALKQQCQAEQGRQRGKGLSKKRKLKAWPHLPRQLGPA